MIRRYDLKPDSRILLMLGWRPRDRCFQPRAGCHYYGTRQASVDKSTSFPRSVILFLDLKLTLRDSLIGVFGFELVCGWRWLDAGLFLCLMLEREVS